MNTYIKFNYDKRLSEVFDKYKAFYAFSKEQYEEKIKAFGIAEQKRVRLDSWGGLIALKSNYKELLRAMDDIILEEVAYEKKHNSNYAICKYHFANYECQISGYLGQALAVIKDYGITKEEALKHYETYFNYCVENDLF